MKQISKGLDLIKLLLLVLSFSIVYTAFPTANIGISSNQVTISNNCNTTSTPSLSSTINCNSSNLVAFLMQFKQPLKAYHLVGASFIKMISCLSFLLIERIYRPPRAYFVVNFK